MVAITLPDGSVRDFDGPVTGADLAAAIGPGLAKAALAIVVDGEMLDLAATIERDAAVAIVTARSDEALGLLRHDAAHLMAEAVKELYADTQVTIGPAIENGFYYDFSRGEAFTPDDLEKIEARCTRSSTAMRRLRAKSGRATTPSSSFAKTANSTRRRSSRASRRTRMSASIARVISSTSAAGRTCRRRASSAMRSS